MFSHTESLESQAEKINGKPLEEHSTHADGAESPEQSARMEQPEVSDEARNGGGALNDIAARLAEAEKRGFMKAMALKAEELFNRPTAGCETFPKPDAEESAASDVIVLSHIRRSVWD